MKGLPFASGHPLSIPIVLDCLPAPVPAVIPSAIDPPTGERDVVRGAILVHSQPVHYQPGAPGDGLLGLSRVDGRRDGSRFLIIPELERPRGGTGSSEVPRPQPGHYHRDPRQPPGARAERSGSER